MVVSDVSCTDEGKYEGFFRIPKVASFLSFASIHLREGQITKIPAVFAIDEKLKELLPGYEKMGEKLVAMHKVEQKFATDNNYSYPTIPSWAESNIAQPLDSEPPLTTSISPAVRSVAPEYAESYAAERSRIEELIHFVNVSALRSDSSSKLESHERQYNMLLNEDPEMYLCFREQNPTYQLMLSVLQTKDRFYLARLMLWRVYGWGLETQVQKRLQFGEIKSGRGFYNKWSNVRDEDGMEALRVTAYGGQFYQNVPVDVKGMETIWNGGMKLWSDWKDRLPLTFAEAEKSIALSNLPLYTRGRLSQILLYGDLVRMGVVVSPTEIEMAKLIVKANSGAMRGLEVLGWERNVDGVEQALSSIRDALNTELSPSAKALFHGGEVGAVDLEHVLCKVSRKQSISATMSPGWATTRTGKRRLKRKGRSEEKLHSLQEEQKRRKI